MHPDRTTGQTVALVCAAEPFRGATVTEIVPLHQRSLCYRLRFADGRSAFVKRAATDGDDGAGGSVGQEAAVLRHLSGRELPVPDLFATLGDPRSPVLVTEAVTGQGSLESCRQDAGGSSPAWSRAVARGLAAVHAVESLPESFPRSEPARRLVRAWTVVTPRDVSRHAGGFAEALRRLRRDGLVPLLQEAAGEWTPTALVHGDVKADNILCRTPEDPRPLALVDWETGGLGDPRWDVGCLIGDLLFTWLSGIDLDAGPALDDWIAAADPPFGAVQADIAAAALEYASLLPVSPTDRRLWVRFAAFFLLQRLCSAAVHSQVLPTRSLAYLQVAGQLLRRPDECAELLLCP